MEFIDILFRYNNSTWQCTKSDDDVAQEKEITHMDSQNLAASTKSRKFNISDLHLNTRQIILSLKTDTPHRSRNYYQFSIIKREPVSTLLRPDKIYSNLFIYFSLFIHINNFWEIKI